MKTNEGLADRLIRVTAGLALLSLVGIGPVPGWGLAGLIGVIPLVTGLVGYCPTYTLLGIDTRGGLTARQKGDKPWIGRSLYPYWWRCFSGLW